MVFFSSSRYRFLFHFHFHSTVVSLNVLYRLNGCVMCCDISWCEDRFSRRELIKNRWKKKWRKEEISRKIMPSRRVPIKLKTVSNEINTFFFFFNVSHLYHYETHLFSNLNRSSNNHLTSFNLLWLFSFTGCSQARMHTHIQSPCWKKYLRLKSVVFNVFRVHNVY